MRLEEITIENFCSCSHVNIPLSVFSPVIGYNNAGKSNILRAIVWLLRKSSLSSSKFNDINSRVVVSGVIFDPDISMLPPNQQTQIGRFVSNSRLTFRRIQETPNARAIDIKIEVASKKHNGTNPFTKRSGFSCINKCIVRCRKPLKRAPKNRGICPIGICCHYSLK